MKKINIAIDGFSSCGKSTLARHLAAKLNFVYIDTGAMYRAVTLYLLKKGIIGNNEINEEKVADVLDEIEVSFHFNTTKNVSETYLNGENVEGEIRGMEVSSWVSGVSQIKAVRQKLVQIQQKIGEQKGVVMEGRDIGSVVFPNAELKLFMTAKKDIRVKRRYDELLAKGQEITLKEVSENIDKRDHNDVNREENPLIKAKDAVVIDNSNLSQDAQLSLAYQLAQDKIEDKVTG